MDWKCFLEKMLAREWIGFVLILALSSTMVFAEIMPPALWVTAVSALLPVVMGVKKFMDKK